MSPRIAVLSFAIGDLYKKVTSLAVKNKKNYCSKHGYDFIDDESVVDSSRAPAWSKILLIQKYLPTYDYVVWIDADTLILNFDVTLEERINRLMGDKDIMFGSDWICINSGVMFIKNTQFSMQFFQDAWNKTEFLSHSNWEQAAIINLYDNNHNQCKDHIAHIAFPRQTEFNSYWYNVENGHFILHFAGCGGQPYTIEHLIKKYYPERLDEDNDESYNIRMNWMKSNQMYIDARRHVEETNRREAEKNGDK